MNNIDILKKIQELKHKQLYNYPLTLEEWNILCMAHLYEKPEIYNVNGSLKSVCELEGKDSKDLYGTHQ
jgi:hypothetical protein